MGSVTSLSSGAMTISDASQWRVEMQARGMSPRTIVERLRIVDRISAHCGATATELTREDLLAYLARDMAPSSRATYWAALRAWSGWLQRTGRRTDDPTATLDAPRTPKCSPHPITTDQLMALLGSDMWQSTRAMVILAAWAGLRVHEIAKVRGEDVDGGFTPGGGQGWAHGSAANAPRGCGASSADAETWMVVSVACGFDAPGRPDFGLCRAVALDAPCWHRRVCA